MFYVNLMQRIVVGAENPESDAAADEERSAIVQEEGVSGVSRDMQLIDQNTAVDEEELALFV